MDYILFVFIGLYFLKGYVKGFVSTLLSLISVFAVVLVSWKLSEICIPYVSNVFYQPTSQFISQILDTAIDGSFANIDQFKSAILNSRLSMFIFLENLLGDLSFDGNLTASQILSPSLSMLVCKIITFLTLFLILSIFIKLLKLFLNKIIKACGLSFGNRLLGGVLGILKGVFLFSILYFVLWIISNIILNDSLNNFIQEGVISNCIYKWVAKFVL